MMNKEIEKLIEDIAFECERDVKLWPKFKRRVEIVRGHLDVLKKEMGCQFDLDAVESIGFELRRRARQALGIDELEVETNTSQPAKSYKGACRRREKSAKGNPEVLAQYGCEDDERMHHRKSAWKLNHPRSLVHEEVVRGSDGRIVAFEWRRRWWDDED